MTEVILITVLVVAAFYLFFIRPTRSEERRRQQDLTELSFGDTVLTRGGLIAEVVDVETPEGGPQIILLKLADGVVVRARTAAIAERIEAASDDESGDGSDDEIVEKDEAAR